VASASSAHAFGTLEIVPNEVLGQASVEDAVIGGGMGEFHVPVSSIRQRFLEALRLRSEACRLDR
jgi:serine/threonine-protein kinase HipA